jgi:hypothetical protein
VTASDIVTMNGEQPTDRPSPAGARGAVVALVVFAAAAAWSLARHSMWFDETQSWAIARSAHSLGGLWRNLRYEGHPPLWHLVLFVLTRFTTDVRAMQVVTWCVATTSAAVVLFRAPWRLPVRILICASYLFAFEYTVLSRSYALTVLGFVVALAARRGSPVRVVALVLVCFTSILGVVLAAALVASDLVARARPTRRVVVGALVVAVAALLAGLSALPPADSRAADGFGERLSGSLSVRAGVTFGGVAEGLLPIPDRPVNWNHTAFRQVPLTARGVVGLAIALGITLLLLRRRRALVLWLVGAGGLLAVFTFVYPPTNLRHAGHLAIVLLGALWVDAAEEREAAPWPRAATVTWAALLVVGAVAGVATVVTYWSRDFDDVQRTAEVIERQYPGAELVSVSELSSTPVGAYLDRPVYSAMLRRPVWFVRYDSAALRAKAAPVPVLVAAVRAHVGCARRAVIVLTSPARHAVLHDLGASPIGRNTGVLPAGWGCGT